MKEKLEEARDILHARLCRQRRPDRTLARVARIIEELAEAWTDWNEDDVAALPSDHNYSALQFIDEPPF